MRSDPSSCDGDGEADASAAAAPSPPRVMGATTVMNSSDGDLRWRLHLETSTTAGIVGTVNNDKAAKARREESIEQEDDDRPHRQRQRRRSHIHGAIFTSKDMSGNNGYTYDDAKPSGNDDDKTKRRRTAASSLQLLPCRGGAGDWGWSVRDVVGVARRHPIPCAFALSLLFFMGVEYTLLMVPPSSPPFDIGFILTRPLHQLLATRPALNSVLAALNTVFVGMQAAYILWTLLVDGRPRATISTLFMFTCRGILGYATQLPLPQGFLGSGVDFPVGNVSFFLFFSGHVAGSVIAAVDMRRVGRHQMAWAFDALNLLQSLRLLATRGHYTIDLAVGIGAGLLFDVLAGRYEESKMTMN